MKCDNEMPRLTQRWLGQADFPWIPVQPFQGEGEAHLAYPTWTPCCQSEQGISSQHGPSILDTYVVVVFSPTGEVFLPFCLG